MQGSGRVVQLAAVLPEGARSELGVVNVSLIWSNWCGGGPVRVRWLDPVLGDAEVPDAPVPSCDDRTRPSTLKGSVQR